MSNLEEFKLDNYEFIELNKLLKFLAWVETGGEAKIRIAEGEVEVNGEVEFRKRCKLRKGDKVSYQGLEVVII